MKKILDILGYEVLFVSPAFMLPGIRDCFIISFCGVSVVVCHRYALYSRQYLIQIWHVDVTAPQGVLYSFVILNSH